MLACSPRARRTRAAASRMIPATRSWSAWRGAARDGVDMARDLTVSLDKTLVSHLRSYTSKRATGRLDLVRGNETCRRAGDPPNLPPRLAPSLPAVGRRRRL